MDKLTLRTGSIILLIIWILISAVFYGKNIADMPKGHHAWTLSDYYAMSVKFAENGLNLFHPQTFNLGTKDGITASDLPLPAWISGASMRLLGTESPAVFRLWTLCIGFLGFYFFFKSLIEQGLPVSRAIVLTLFFWLLPGLVYYHDGFLPTTWALNAFLVGLWALQRDLKGDQRYWRLAVGALVLAALLRKPYFLPLFGLGVWQIFFRKNTRKTIVWAMGVAVFGLWQLYDQYLLREYGSIFLRQLMSPHSVAEMVELVKNAWVKWGFKWFSPVHLAWLLLAIALTVTSLRKKDGPQKSSLAWYLLAVSLLGVFYFVLMLRQFNDHDYYGIDSFYPVVFVGVVVCAPFLGAWKRLPGAEAVLLSIALFYSFSVLSWYKTLTPNIVAEKTNQVYLRSRPLLDSLGVGRDAKMMVFEAYSSNMPLIGMGRNGYCLLSSSPAAQQKILDLRPDYAVCLDTNFISEVVKDKPDIVKNLDFVGRNKDLWVFRPGSFPENTLEKLLATHASTIADTSTTSAEEYLMTKSLPVEVGSKVVFHGMAGVREGGEIKATVSLFKSGTPVAVLEKTLFFAPNQEPVYRATDINIPAVAADEMRIYLWNPNHRSVVFTNFNIAILHLKPLAGR